MTKLPMGKELWCGPAEPVEPVSCPFGLAAQAFELPARPANDIEINPFEGRTQRCPIEAAKVVDPATDARVSDRDQIIQGFVTMQMKPPASDGSADRLQSTGTDCGHEAVGVKAAWPYRLSCPEGEPQEIKRDKGVVALPIGILAIDDLRLFRMQRQLAGQ